MPEPSLSRAKTVAERIRKRVMNSHIVTHQVQFGDTVSIGIAEASVSMSGIDALMSAADHVLYQACCDSLRCPCARRHDLADRGLANLHARRAGHGLGDARQMGCVRKNPQV